MKKNQTDRQTLFDPKHSVVSLVGDSGIQFLDYEVDVSKLRMFKELRFHDQPETVSENETKIVDRLLLHIVEDQDRDLPKEDQPAPEDREFESIFNANLKNIPLEETYTAQAKVALSVFDRQWLPLPFFRGGSTGTDVEDGPSNWARVFLAAPDPAEGGSVYRIVFAFDTELCEQSDDKPYAGPGGDDCSPLVRFRLAQDLSDLARYISGDWQQSWIKESYLEGKNRRLRETGDGVKRREYSLRNQGEAYAHYLTLISVLHEITTTPAIRFVRGAGTRPEDPPMTPREQRGRYIDVDLVLDIGNSRTCGLLVEFGSSDQHASFGAQPPTALQLREIERPYRVSEDPFDSRVEFFPANFGRSRHGRRSRRPSGTDAFWWPSPVRIGKEAAWLAAQTDGRDGESGMSSPKRFVWDEARRPHPWVNNARAKWANGRIPAIQGPLVSKLGENGKPLAARSGRTNANGGQYGKDTAYSRGSLYMLMISELICHALVQINSPSYRYARADTDMPRRLRKIIMTLPSATPLTERDRMRAHARNALKLVWSAYKWKKDDPLHPAPVLNFEWDEATSTQLVYLYNELEFKFLEAPKGFFDLHGNGRVSEKGRPALRIATIDIGGGTTDLMIIEHELVDRVIFPNQLFREGVRVAGDDILKKLIELIILPGIVSAVEAAGDPHPAERVNFLFTNAKGVSREDQMRRAAFVNQILIPCAIRLLSEYENADHQLSEDFTTFTIGDAIDLSSLNPNVLSYLADGLEGGDTDVFNLADVQITMRPAEVSGAAQSVVGASLRDFCDVIRAYDCDLLLVSGRPSGMRAIRDIILASAPVTPDKIVNMYGYRIGNWYPFRSADSRIWDPKTTTSVGAVLCHLLEGDYAHFVFDTRSIKSKTTARYLGRMDESGKIADEEVIFHNTSDGEDAFKEFDVNLVSWVDIGYRQLPYERWPTAQLYRIQFLNEDVARDTRVPVHVKMKREDIGDVEDESELAREKFEIVEALDADGNDVRDVVSGPILQTFRTLKKVEAGYWIDSGVLDTTTIIGDDDRA